MQMTVLKSPWPRQLVLLPTKLQTLKTKREMAANSMREETERLRRLEQFYLAQIEKTERVKQHYEEIDRELAELDGRLIVCPPKIDLNEVLDPVLEKRPNKKQLKTALNDALAKMTDQEKQLLLAELME